MGNQQTKVFIGVPVYGSVDVHFFAALMDFIKAAKDFPHTLHYVAGDSLVSRARNTITMEFLKSDCTHLLFIDSDLVFSIDQIKRLISHGESIIGGFYPKKKDGAPELVFNPTIPPTPMDSRRLTEVRYIGTGFMLIAREVFEKMIAELGDDIVFKVDTKEKVGFDFWPVGVYKYADGSRRYLSEDWYFCQRALDLGFRIFGDNGIMLKHSGNALYPLKSQEAALFSVTPETAEPVNAAATPSPAVAAA
jgi:hypothetical protein